MGLDNYGFPAAAIANAILLEQQDFGDSAMEVEDSWSFWLRNNPVDAKGAGSRSRLMTERLNKMDVDNDGARRQKLERRLKQVEHRAERYRMENFTVQAE